MSESEREYWLRVITELRETYTLEYLAEEFGVTVRQVSNWQTGDIPRGMNAVNLHTFHAKHGTPVHRTGVHGAAEVKA